MDILLEKRELLDMGANLRGVNITCIEGRCWITQAGDNRDHVFGTGGSFKILTPGRLIITATETCRLTVNGEGAQAHPGLPEKPFSGWFTGVAA